MLLFDISVVILLNYGYFFYESVISMLYFIYMPPSLSSFFVLFRSSLLTTFSSAFYMEIYIGFFIFLNS